MNKPKIDVDKIRELAERAERVCALCQRPEVGSNQVCPILVQIRSLLPPPCEKCGEGEFVCKKCGKKLPIYLKAIHQGNKFMSASCKGEPKQPACQAPVLGEIEELLRKAHSKANDILFCIGNDKSDNKDKLAIEVKECIDQAATKLTAQALQEKP